jgi:hypothetical protein
VVNYVVNSRASQHDLLTDTIASKTANPPSAVSIAGSEIAAKASVVLDPE